MSASDQEHEAQQDAELRKLDPTYSQTAPPLVPPAAEEPKRDRDGSLVYPFKVEGTLDAENLNDSYKLLQAHFLALSRGSVYDAPSDISVSVTQA